MDFKKILDRLTLRNKDLRYRLSIIFGLFFLFPVSGFLIFAIKYDLMNNEYILLFFLGILIFSFLGFTMLRRVFDQISMISNEMSKTEISKLTGESLQKETNELHNIVQSFSNIESQFSNTFTALQRKSSEISILKELSELCFVTFDPTEILYVTLERALLLTNSDIGSVMILSKPDRKSFIVKASIGSGEFVKVDDRIDFDTSISKYAVINKSPIVVKDIESDNRFQLKMLHFFINTGIKDNAYYWNELSKCVNVYCELKKICPELDTLNIGGGFPIKNSLGFDFDYEYITEEIVAQIKNICNQNDVVEPDIFTEFGAFTVGESGAVLYSILDQKQQNDREHWNMIDSSFMTTIPDIWASKQRFILLAINNWDHEYQRVNLGGLTCDSMDYYNAELHANAIFLPKIKEDDTQYIGMFHTGAYQESLGGFGGIQHCLIPAPKLVIIDKDEEGEYTTKLFAKEQSYKSMLKTLGF